MHDKLYILYSVDRAAEITVPLQRRADSKIAANIALSSTLLDRKRHACDDTGGRIIDGAAIGASNFGIGNGRGRR